MFQATSVERTLEKVYITKKNGGQSLMMIKTNIIEEHSMRYRAPSRRFSCAIPLLVAPLLVAMASATIPLVHGEEARLPNIVFVMADDMGWGQTGYRNHPILKTPNLDTMAASGLRFERFYAGGPVCSPTRSSMLTGRSHERTGVLSHGYALRVQEKTIAQALNKAGYVTGHFGKWHLNGHRGPGAPIFAEDPHSPGKFGFNEWVSVSNFFDVDPIMSRAGKFEELRGDSSELAVNEAISFLDRNRASNKPMFAVIWYGSPHSPFKASAGDRAAFAELDETSSNHYGELVAMDRSIGTLRSKLREFGIEKQTLLVFCSDNGGLPEIKPETVGGLRGNKGSVFEGGIRVPGIIEWPSTISARITHYPACVMDLFPTVAELVKLPNDSMVQPIDGKSLVPLFKQEIGARNAPIGFRYTTKRALVDDRFKLLTENISSGEFQLFDLVDDPHEKQNLKAEKPEIFQRMKDQLMAWDATVDASFGGKDYSEGRVTPPDPTGTKLPSINRTFQLGRIAGSSVAISTEILHPIRKIQRRNRPRKNDTSRQSTLSCSFRFGGHQKLSAALDLGNAACCSERFACDRQTEHHRYPG
jgi:arylsulfatase A-like enzyme